MFVYETCFAQHTNVTTNPNQISSSTCLPAPPPPPSIHFHSNCVALFSFPLFQHPPLLTSTSFQKVEFGDRDSDVCWGGGGESIPPSEYTPPSMMMYKPFSTVSCAATSFAVMGFDIFGRCEYGIDGFTDSIATVMSSSKTWRGPEEGGGVERRGSRRAVGSCCIHLEWTRPALGARKIFVVYEMITKEGECEGTA